MRHDKLVVPPCDLLVHAGDFTRRGRAKEAQAFFAWLAEQPARHKVAIAGNHDRICEREPDRVRQWSRDAGVQYLCDEATEIEGLRIFGSPVTPTFRNMAFNRDPGEAIRAHWRAIPEELDLLITHGPPRSILDRMVAGLHVGCVDLLERVRQVQPRWHVFGHIHEARGEARFPGLRTRFFNVANARLLPVGTRAPTMLTLEG